MFDSIFSIYMKLDIDMLQFEPYLRNTLGHIAISGKRIRYLMTESTKTIPYPAAPYLAL